MLRVHRVVRLVAGVYDAGRPLCSVVARPPFDAVLFPRAESLRRCASVQQARVLRARVHNGIQCCAGRRAPQSLDRSYTTLTTIRTWRCAYRLETRWKSTLVRDLINIIQNLQRKTHTSTTPIFILQELNCRPRVLHMKCPLLPNTAPLQSC